MKLQNFVFVQFFAVLLLALTSGGKKEITNLPPAFTTTAVTNNTANQFPVNFKTEDGICIGSFRSSVTNDWRRWYYYTEIGTNELDTIFEAYNVEEIFLSDIAKIEFNSAIWKKVLLQQK